MAYKANKPICGAIKDDGKICRRGKGKDTEHPGEGHCSTHDLTKDQELIQETRVRRGKAIKQNLAVLIGREMDVTPSEALMSCIRITAAEVMYFEMQIALLTDTQITYRPTRQELDRYGDKHEMKQNRELNLWIRERQKSVDRLAKYSKMALDVGIEAHKVRVAERYGEVISTALQRIFQRMDIDPRKNRLLPTIIREELAAIETQNYLRNPLVNPVGQKMMLSRTEDVPFSPDPELEAMIHADRPNKQQGRGTR